MERSEIERRFALAISELKNQREDLNQLKGRTIALYSATAVLVSLATGLGLLNSDPSKGAVIPIAMVWTLVSTLVVMTLVVIYVVWPFYVPRGIECSKLVGEINTESEEGETTLAEYSTQLRETLVINDKKLGYKSNAFCGLPILLIFSVVELALLVVITR